jgi:transcriptional antiterminator NusG
MTDTSHTQAEEALATGDGENAAEPALTDDVVDEVVAGDEAELEAVADDAAADAVAEEIAEDVRVEASEDVVEEAAEEIVEDAVLEAIAEDEVAAPPAASDEPDLVLDATGNGAAAEDADEPVELGGWGHDDEDEEEVVEVESPYDRPGRWYVVHTYSGYENKVRSNMGYVVASGGLEDRVFEVVIPLEDVD